MPYSPHFKKESVPPIPFVIRNVSTLLNTHPLQAMWSKVQNPSDEETVFGTLSSPANKPVLNHNSNGSNADWSGISSMETGGPNEGATAGSALPNFAQSFDLPVWEDVVGSRIILTFSSTGS